MEFASQFLTTFILHKSSLTISKDILQTTEFNKLNQTIEEPFTSLNTSLFDILKYEMSVIDVARISNQNGMLNVIKSFIHC